MVKAGLGLGVRAVLLQSTDLVTWNEVKALTGEGAEKPVIVLIEMPAEGGTKLFLKLQLRERNPAEEQVK